MSYYKVKDKSDISSEKVIILLEAVKHLYNRLKEIRKECNHSWEKTGLGHSSDGYGNDESYTSYFHCTICGETEIKEE